MKKSLCILFAIALSAGSCMTEEREVCPKSASRVLLVYVGTDNTLAGLEQEKLEALRNGWTGKASDRIIVYRDTYNADARLMEISNLRPSDKVREIATYGKENSASKEVFGRVINDVMSMFPDAESYGLLVFSHASGWLPPGSLNNPTEPTYSRSIIIDGEDEMKIADFADAIPDGAFDYIVFEACLMAGIEVAYELRDKTPVILASSAEIVHPGFAKVYSASTPKLFEGNIEGFAQDVFDKVLTYDDDKPQRSATYSVIRTAPLTQLAAFVRENCDFDKPVNIAEVQHFDRTGYRLFFDFEDYCGRLLDTDEQRTRLSQLISDCVVWKQATESFLGINILHHSGFTSYIGQPAFAGLNAAYGELDWVKATR